MVSASAAAADTEAGRQAGKLEPLRYELRLREQQQIIPASGLGIRSGHVEAAERMNAYERSGTFTIEIKVADMELLPGQLQMCTVVGEDSAGQTVIGLIGHGQGFFE